MLDWHSTVADDLVSAVSDNVFWKSYLEPLVRDRSAPFDLHLAVCIEPFLRYILDGQKTIESRFSSMRCAPYERVKLGDVVLLKKAGGPVVGLCQIASVRFYQLEEDSWREIKTFATEICAEDPTFWEAREDASFATLMRIKHVQAINPIKVEKKDRRGWVVLQRASQQPTLEMV
jgi:ASC-1-like (ASCH) protein